MIFSNHFARDFFFPTLIFRFSFKIIIELNYSKKLLSYGFFLVCYPFVIPQISRSRHVGENYEFAKGSRQSPIDIPPNCEIDSKLSSAGLNFEYETKGKMLINTGAGFKVNFDRMKKSCNIVAQYFELIIIIFVIYSTRRRAIGFKVSIGANALPLGQK